MKKLLHTAIAVSIIIFIVTGCVAEAENSAISFVVLQPDQLPAAIETFLQENKYYEAAAVFQDDKFIYVVINRGAMPTDGYSVKINSIYNSKQGAKHMLRINVEYTNPDYDTQVKDTITYPYCVARINYMNLTDYTIEFHEDDRNIASITDDQIIVIK